jgi:hypothetical protein
LGGWRDGGGVSISAAIKIARLIEAGKVRGDVSVRAITRMLSSDVATVRSALGILVRYEWLTPVASSSKGGRPSELYEVSVFWRSCRLPTVGPLIEFRITAVYEAGTEQIATLGPDGGAVAVLDDEFAVWIERHPQSATGLELGDGYAAEVAKWLEFLEYLDPRADGAASRLTWMDDLGVSRHQIFNSLTRARLRCLSDKHLSVAFRPDCVEFESFAARHLDAIRHAFWSFTDSDECHITIVNDARMLVASTLDSDTHANGAPF